VRCEQAADRAATDYANANHFVLFPEFGKK